MQPETLGWVATAAVVVGLLVRLFKTDTFVIAIANLGLPPIPKRALPWIAFGLGLVSSVLDHRLQGTAWVEAITKGTLAAVAAIAGHDLGKAVPGVRKVLAVGALLVLPASTTGCAWLQKKGPDLIEIFARKSACALEHMNLPNETIIRECALQPGDIERIFNLVGTARTEAARETVAARNDERARQCSDAGAP